MTSEEMVRKVFEKIIEDAKDRFTLEPGESIELECGDAPGDGPFEIFIHNELSDYMSYCYDTDHVDVELKESYH